MKKEFKDLKVKVGSKKEALWTKVRDNCKNQIETLGDEIIVAKTLMDAAEKKIQVEQDKQKSLNK